LITVQATISECITQFYKHLYIEGGFQCPLLDGLSFSTITEEDAQWLERPFEEKVLGVVKSLNGDKVPGGWGGGGRH
jgi:hypothetical protein